MSFLMKEITTEIEIDSSAGKVWAILLDFENYPAWNPFIREISGMPTVGSKLRVVIKSENGMGATLAPIVISADEDRIFSWKGKLAFSGIFDGLHEFILEPKAEGKTKFIHREQFSGFLVPIVFPMLKASTQQGFEQMNSSLKVRAEGN